MNKTLYICCIAMLSALSVVANFCTIPLSGNNSVSFTIAVCFFTGIYFGAGSAAIVGFTGDLIAHFIHPMRDYNWFIALSVTLFGVVCALTYKLKLHRVAKLAIAAIITYIVCLCGLNTFGLWLQYCVNVPANPIGVWKLASGQYESISKTFWVYLGGRAPMSAVNLVVNAAIVAALQESAFVARSVARLKKSTTSPDERNGNK